MIRNQAGSSAAEVLLKFCMVFVISLFAFAVGTFVGKKFTEDQQRLTSLEGQKRQAASVQEVSQVVEPESALSDADIESLTEEFSDAESQEIANALSDRNVAEESKETEELAEKALNELDKDLKEMKKEEEASSASPETSTKPKEKTQAKIKPKESDASSEVAKRIAKDEKEVIKKPEVKKDRRPASYPKLQAASSAGKYTVQVASYQSEEEAKSYVSELTTKGYTSFYVEADVKGKTWYRVSIGLFKTQSKANNYMKELYQEAKLKGFVTRVVK